MKTEVIDVTPEMAQRWLAATGDKNFRSPEPKRVAVLARAMQRGEWQLNGEAIKLNGTIVLDGQHRLAAIILSGCTIRTLVVNELETATMHTMDRGRSRNIGQDLRYDGVQNGSKVASVLRAWFLYRMGAWNKRDTRHPVGGPITDGEYLEFFAAHEQRIIDATRLCDMVEAKMAASALLPRTIAGVIIAEGTLEHFNVPHESDQAEEFMRVLRMGGGHESDPLTLLRNQLIADRVSTRRMTPQVKAAVAIHAWNLFLKGGKVRVLAYRLSGTAAREFPKIAQAEV